MLNNRGGKGGYLQVGVGGRGMSNKYLQVQNKFVSIIYFIFQYIFTSSKILCKYLLLNTL